MQFKTASSLAVVVAFALGSGTAFAQDMSKSGKPMTAQQEKMKNCNAQAKAQAMAGDARKTFMKTCLSTSGAAPAAMPVATKQTQQEKMKTCSADAKAKSLKGADRKTYMSTCLSGDGAAAH